MRFYDIVIKDQKTGNVWIPPSMKKLGLTDVSYSSLMKDRRTPNPSALQVIFTLTPVTSGSQRETSLVNIMGVSLEDISQFVYLNDKQIEVFAGMMPGLPLASAQVRTNNFLQMGRALYSSGNWQDKNISLMIVMVPGVTVLQKPTDKPVTLQLSWPKGSDLGPALKTSIETAFPDFKVKVNFDPIIAQDDMVGLTYANIDTLMSRLQEITSQPPYKKGDDYLGVKYLIQGGEVILFDNSQQNFKYPRTKPCELKFIDLIGQPSWKTSTTMTFKAVMRGDIVPGDYVKLPSFLGTPYVHSLATMQNAPPNTETVGQTLPARNAMAFKGTFQVQRLHHFADFRSAQADTWVTQYDCVYWIEPTPAGVPSQPQGPLGGGGV